MEYYVDINQFHDYDVADNGWHFCTKDSLAREKHKQISLTIVLFDLGAFQIEVPKTQGNDLFCA
jgi:hypothetical protein